MAVTTSELRAVLTLQNQMSQQLRVVTSELTQLGNTAKTAGTAAASSGPGWTSMASAMMAGQLAANGLQTVLGKVTSMVMSAGKSTADFGQSMANIRASVPTEDFNKYGSSIEKLAIRLGKDYPLSATEAAGAIEVLVKKGTSLENVLGGGAEAVVKLSSATGGDLKVAAEVANAALDTFHMKAEDLNVVADKMTGTMLSSGLSLQDYQYSMTYAGSTVVTLGQNIDDLNLALVVQAKAGMEGSVSGTTYKNMILGLNPHTKKAKELMEELGLTTADGANKFFDAQGKMKDYDSVAHILAKSVEGLTEVQKTSVYQTLFGEQGFTAAAMAVDYANGKYGDVKKTIESMSNATEASNKRMDSFTGSMQQFGGSAETVGLILFSRLAPGLKSVVDVGTNLLNDFLKELEDDSWTKSFEAFHRSVSATGSSIQTFAEGPFETFLQTLAKCGPVGRIAAEGLGLIQGPLAGIGYLLQGDVTKATAAFSQGIGDIRNSLAGIADVISPANTAISDIIATMAKLGQKISDQEGWKTVRVLINDIGIAAGSAAQDLGKVSAALSKLYQTVSGGRGELDGVALGFKVIATVLNLAVLSMSFVITTTATLIQMMTGLAQVMIGTAKATVAMVTGNQELANSAARDVAQGFLLQVNAAKEWATKSSAIVGAAQGTIGDLIRTGATQNAAEVERGMKRQAAATSAGMQEIEANVDTGLNGVTQITAAQAAKQEQLQIDNVKSQVNAFKMGLIPTVQATEQAMDGVSQAIGAAGPTMAAEAASATAQVTGAVQAEAGPAQAAGTSVGSSIAAGMQTGMLSWMGGLIATARSLVANVFIAGQAEAEAHSPSERAARELGRPIPEGIIKEFEKMSPEVGQAARDMMDAALAYQPVAAKIAGVEKEIKEITEAAETAALFRGKQMITITSEILRLKVMEAEKARDMVSTQRALAAVSREIEAIERGTIEQRRAAIGLGVTHSQNNIRVNELEREKIPLQQRSLEIERALIGLDPEGKKAKQLQKEQEEIRKKTSLIDNTIAMIRLETREQDLQAESAKELRSIQSAGARIRQDELQEAERLMQDAIRAIQDEISALEKEKAVFDANEAVIKNATENEIKYRKELIAVFTAEGKPLKDRIDAGLKMVDQLEAEGKISTELAGHMRELIKKTMEASGATGDLGSAATTVKTPLDKAGAAAMAMAEANRQLADASRSAGNGVSYLAERLGRLPDWFRPGRSGGLFNPSVNFGSNNREGSLGQSQGVMSDLLATSPLANGGGLPPTGGHGSVNLTPQFNVYIGTRELTDWWVETAERVEREGRE